MARVTIEDCRKFASPFNLVLLAALRARQISAGSALKIERDEDKNPVVALREIADEAITVETLKEDLIASFQRHLPVDEESDEDLEAYMEAEQTWDATEDLEAELEDFAQIEDADTVTNDELDEL